MAAQINRLKPHASLGFLIFTSQETDTCSPQYNKGDMIVPQTGNVEQEQGTLSRSGKEDNELGKWLEIQEGVGPGMGCLGQEGPSEGKDGFGQGVGDDGKDSSYMEGPTKGKDGLGEGRPTDENASLGDRGPGAVEAQPAGEATGDVIMELEEKVNDIHHLLLRHQIPCSSRDNT